MYVDLWEWFNGYYRYPDERQRLPQCFSEARKYMEKAPQQALSLLDQGRLLADKLAEPFWVLFFEYWQCEMHTFYIEDLNAGMDLAVRMTVEARKPLYKQCPVLPRVYRVLLDTYVLCDPVGYEDKIRETLAYMETEITLDYDTHCLLETRKARLADALEDFAEVKAATLRYLALSENNGFQKSSAYLDLCYISYREGDLDATLGFANEAETWARRFNRRRRVSTALSWQALVARKKGNEETALRHFRQALAQAEELGVAPSYYEPLCEFHEAGGQSDTALKLRERQLSELAGKGYNHDECELRLKRCRLLGRMGLPLDDEVAEARTAGDRLLKPARFLAKLDRVLQGDYTEQSTRG